MLSLRGPRGCPITLASTSMFFFFSSRRWHTRLVSDWSSDVCSSDLRGRAGELARRRLDEVRARSHCQERGPPNVVVRSELGHLEADLQVRVGGRFLHLDDLVVDLRRSEERRVGKEWRSWW